MPTPHTPALLAGLAVLLSCVPAPAADPRGDLLRAPRRPSLPAVRDHGWLRNPVDAFILARLEARGLAPRPRADRLRLLRRVTFDLTGLPPTVAEQDAFLADDAPDAYEKVVERLLAAPHFGERWAQHWLDLVRYAESDGFKADDLRPAAHRYRDYVIAAFNADLPYDRFVRQQLAGDELEPDNPQARVATGLERLWPDEYNAANLEQRRQEILDDITDTNALVFLGLTFGCARCHDHKFDPITHKDYYRLQAFFAALKPRDDVPAATPAERHEYARRLAAWQNASKALRAEQEALIAKKRAELRAHALTKFRAEIQEAVRTAPDRRTPYQWQIALMAEKQMDLAAETAPNSLPPEKKKRYQELVQRLAALTPPRPAPLPAAHTITDLGRTAPPTYRLLGGDWRKPRQQIEPAFPSFLEPAPLDTHLPPGVESTGRRAALARWLTRTDHPLTARVIVNRLWQHHFGVGLIATPNDFGLQGESATHPELLDYLAVELVEHGWSLKHLHRLLVTSAAYCQDSCFDPRATRREQAADPDNHLLWHARRRRLEGESLRDAMLCLSGDLSARMHGPSARPRLPAGISKYAWKPDDRPEDRNRRSVYVLVRRNLRFPLFDAFDLPDLHNSCARRARTTTAPQALLLLNGDFTREQAAHLAARLRAAHEVDEASLVSRAYRLAWGRHPTSDEVRLGLRFLHDQEKLLRPTDDARAAAIVDFCHALLNSNEFLYVD